MRGAEKTLLFPGVGKVTLLMEECREKKIQETVLGKPQDPILMQLKVVTAGK